MSENLPQNSENGAEKSSSGGKEDKHPSNYTRPQYMTVGTGSTSASAAALMASLDNDGVYDGSMSNGSSTIDSHGWNPRLTQDMPTPSGTPTDDRPGISPDAERRILASHVHQMHYNRNRAALSRAIQAAVTLLTELRETNLKWPAHYPSISEGTEMSRPRSRPGLPHTQSTIGEQKSDISRPGSLRRAATQLGDLAESSNAPIKQAEEIPEGLITPRASQEFSILKLDLKLQGSTQSEIAHSIGRQAIASLLNGRINQSIRHLQRLKDRIEDTSSKVLVTGDLKAGKSTFCNALLRRKVLPEDELPCTTIFCEVLDVSANAGIEEVHAIHKNITYNRLDESTFDSYSLNELEKIVSDKEKYDQCKVYVKNIRSIDQSLLNNGVVDIALIDAPGLNSDSLQTTAVFARQEEIDVVVFVVSAQGNLTLSGKEFIWNAANEKAYIFVVVNGIDNIKKKERYQQAFLEQIAHLSPRTFKESSELVHFVSSNAVPTAPIPAGGPSGSSSSGGSGSGGFGDPDGSPDDDDEDDLTKHGEPGSPGKGKGKDKQQIQDFEHLEASLRRFVLEKRARSKLAPAKTYTTNVFNDLHHLATINRDMAQGELDRANSELSQIEPAYERSKRASHEVTDMVDRLIEATCDDIRTYTRESLNKTINEVAETELGVEYPGFWSAFQYAEDIKVELLSQISDVLATCEADARQRTVQEVNNINSISKKNLGDDYEELSFKSDTMFNQKRDQLARQVDIPVEIWDLCDLTSLWDRQEKVAGTSLVLGAASMLGGRLVGGVGWFDGALGMARAVGFNNLKQLIVPGLILSACLVPAYIVYSIPHTLPRRLSKRISATLFAVDYVDKHSYRISQKVGKVLRVPANHLRAGLRLSIESLSTKREDAMKIKEESSVARKYFSNLVRESQEHRRIVEDVNLEGAAPGVAAGYESGPML